jgi:hypothetical protein
MGVVSEVQSYLAQHPYIASITYALVTELGAYVATLNATTGIVPALAVALWNFLDNYWISGTTHLSPPAPSKTTSQQTSQVSSGPSLNAVIISGHSAVSGTGFAPNTRYVVDLHVNGVGDGNIAGGSTDANGNFTAVVNQSFVSSTIQQAGGHGSGYVLAYNLVGTTMSDATQVNISF